MRVKDFMTRGPRTIYPETGVRTAFRMMKKGGFKQLPVVEDGVLVGIVTDRNIRRPDIVDEDDDWSQLYKLDDEFSVRSIMTTKVITVREEDTLEEACRILRKEKFNALPVVSEKGDLTGILTLHDLLEPLLRFIEGEGG